MKCFFLNCFLVEFSWDRDKTGLLFTWLVDLFTLDLILFFFFFHFGYLFLKQHFFTNKICVSLVLVAQWKLGYSISSKLEWKKKCISTLNALILKGYFGYDIICKFLRPEKNDDSLEGVCVCDSYGRVSKCMSYIYSQIDVWDLYTYMCLCQSIYRYIYIYISVRVWDSYIHLCMSVCVCVYMHVSLTHSYVSHT